MKEKNRGKRNEIIVLIVSNVIIAALFIGSWLFHGGGTMPIGADILMVPDTNLFLAWLPFIIVSVVQLVCILKSTPLATLIVSALKTVIYCAVCVIAISASPYHPDMEITGIQTLFEAYGDLILNWTALIAGILFFVLDLIICLVWMRGISGTRGGRQASGESHALSRSRAEKTWLAGGIIAVVLWYIITCLSSLGPLNYLPEAVIFIVFGIAWWFASKRSRAGSVILFIILTVCAIVSVPTIYSYVVYTGFAGIILTVLEAAALVLWYVFLCILLKRRWRECRETA
ncbi:MAG: phosphoethanolamine transferase CptA [Clostridia bacterium]|nr:phosphoethanolamine transferase CptA [Clostridia bacterium]